MWFCTVRGRIWIVYRGRVVGPPLRRTLRKASHTLNHTLRVAGDAVAVCLLIPHILVPLLFPVPVVALHQVLELTTWVPVVQVGTAADRNNTAGLVRCADDALTPLAGQMVPQG